MPCSIYARQTGAVPSGRKRQRATRPVLERVHLLADDVGRLAHSAHEELRVLEDGRLDLAEAGTLRQDPRLRDDAPAEGRLLGQQVIGPARNLIARSHGLPFFAEGRQEPPAASSARNGFVRRSTPRLVIPMCPG